MEVEEETVEAVVVEAVVVAVAARRLHDGRDEARQLRLAPRLLLVVHQEAAVAGDADDAGDRLETRDRLRRDDSMHSEAASRDGS